MLSLLGPIQLNNFKRNTTYWCSDQDNYSSLVCNVVIVFPHVSATWIVVQLLAVDISHAFGSHVTVCLLSDSVFLLVPSLLLPERLSVLV